MTLISTLHKLSRSIGCALLLVAGGRNLTISFLGGKMCLYLIYKIVRGEFFWWPRLQAIIAVLFGLCARIVVKVSPASIEATNC